jgi:uncharacterized membrane protein YesL
MPRVGAALRRAVRDLADNATPLVMANLAWALVLFVVTVAIARHPLGLVALVLLAPPTAGLTAMATALVRRGHVRLAEFLDGSRRHFGRALGIGAIQLLLAALAAADVLIGAGVPGLPGIVLIVGGGYILVALWIYACVAWPLLLDPLRGEVPVTRVLRLAAILVLARPLGAIGIAALMLAILALGTLLLVPTIAFGAALAGLVAAHWALPAGDHLEGRATLEVEVED